jgi:hypothetical protein
MDPHNRYLGDRLPGQYACRGGPDDLTGHQPQPRSRERYVACVGRAVRTVTALKQIGKAMH